MAELGEGLSGYLDVQDATLRAPRLEAVSNIGIANTAPQHAFSVGSNLYVSTESSDVLTVDGNVACEGVKVGLIEIIPSYGFGDVSNVGNTTANTVIFDNATTGFVTTSNVEIGGQTTIGGHILPNADGAYDLGSPELALREVFTSNNSLWIGDRSKISFENGQMKFKRRKIDKVPKVVRELVIANVGNIETDEQVAAAAVAFAQEQFPDDNITELADLKLQHWRDYTKSIDETKEISDIFVSNDEDYEAQSAADAFKEVGSNIFTTHGVTIGANTEPTATLDVIGNVTVGGPLRLTDGLSNVVDMRVSSTDTITYALQSELHSINPEATAYFGYSVAISSDGNTAIVGTPSKSIPTSDAGAVYIFTRSGTGSSWSEQQRITASDYSSYDELGTSVAISGDGTRIITGSPYDNMYDSNVGSAYIFSLTSLPSDLIVSGGVVASGTTLSFTGQHLCFPEGPIEQGLVVSANKNKFMNLNGPLTTGLSAIKSSESLPIVSLSNVKNDPTVFGVVDRVETLSRERRHTYGGYVVKSDKESGDNRAIINSLGEGAMWVVNTNGNLLSGDYITTSNISGYGQKQDDDILHSYTVAKITMDCDFNPEDLPIQVIKKDEYGNNILDKYGRLQWEDIHGTQKAYKIRHLTIDGEATDESNAVWTAAYVGCTYHCG